MNFWIKDVHEIIWRFVLSLYRYVLHYTMSNIYTIYVHWQEILALETGRKASFSILFPNEFKLILYLPIYVYCVYPAMAKCRKHLPNCRKKRRYTVIVFKVSSVNSTLILLPFIWPPLLVLKITKFQDKLILVIFILALVIKGETK